ncbi:MAG: hypothetical protein ACYCO9_21595 [Streptosporangiaceae bacterium]
MKAMEILAVKHVIPIAAGAGTVPLVGTSSLASFALGALVAGVCFAALTSPWWRGGAMLVPVSSDRSRPSHLDHPAGRAGGYQAGLRGRVAVLLSGLFSDNAEDPGPAPGSSGHEFVDAATAAAARGIRLSDKDAPETSEPAATVSEPEAVSEPPAAAPIPALAGRPRPDESFWGPMSAAERDEADGRQSRHGLAGHRREPRRSGGVRNAPRHAAPPARFSARRVLGARRPARRDEVPAAPGIQTRAS